MNASAKDVAPVGVDAPQRRDCRTILMVGTAVDSMGGISSVVRGYVSAGLFERFDCRYIATHRDVAFWRKALIALNACSRILVGLVRHEPLVHVHLSSRASFWRKSVICQMAKAAGRPYILHVHGSEFMKFYDEESGPRTRRYVSRVFRDAALVLALSEQWRANVQRIAPTARCEVLVNSVVLPDLSSRSVPEGEPQLVVCLGRLGKRKGSFDLVEAFAQLGDLPARLICAGDGAVEEVREHARRLGVADRVTCPGWLSAEDGAKLLARATVFALPSYAEGVPMALLEAMSFALPAITTPVGGIPQVVRDGENGVLVRPGDVPAIAQALRSLLTDSAARERLGRAARGTIEQNFSLAASIEQLAQIYARFGLRAAR